MRIKRIIQNLLTDVIPLVIISVLGIFKLKFFIQILGNETLGLYQLFTQVMIYVALVDGGLASAVLYSLYKPNTDQNDEEMNRILSASLRVFSLIGTAVFTIAFVVSFFVPFFIKDASFSYLYIVFTFMLFSLSNVINYFFVPYQCLLEVKERKYICNLALQIGQIVQSTLEIILLLCHIDFFVILFMHAVVKLLSNIVIVIVCKRIYPNYKYHEQEKNYEFVGQVKHLVFHKINGLIGSNIDVLIISKFLGLVSVSIYSTYNYIINMLKTILGKISSSMLAIIGNLLARGTEEGYKIFKELNAMLFLLATVICVPLTLAIDSFIDIWYEGQIETSHLIALSFAGILCLFIVKTATTTFITAKGLFKETKICAMTDTVVNFTLSLVLVHFIGIPGVLIATVISVFIAEYIMKTIVVYREIFNKSAWTYFIGNLKFIVIYIIDLLVGYFIIDKITITNIGIWFLVFGIYFIVNALLIYGLYYILKQTAFMNRIKKGLKQKKGK